MKSDVVLAAVVVTLATFALYGLAQSVPLTISEVVPVAEQRPLAIREPIKCGSDGYIYVQFVNGSPEPKVNIISNDGAEVYWASLIGVPDLQEGYVRDFAPEPGGGGVYLLVQVSHSQEHPKVNEQPEPPVDQFYIAKFDDTGKHISTTKLNADFHIGRFAVFSRGDEFAVTGYRGKNFHGPDQQLSPVTALFSSSGEVLRYVPLQRDVTSKSVTQHFHNGQSMSLGEIQIIDLSFLEDGGDGNVYLVRGTSAGPMYSISPGGEVHRINLSPPSKEATLLSVKVVQSEIVAEYKLPRDSPETPGTTLLAFFDRKGHLRQQYGISDRQAGVGMACYADHSFTFLASGKDRTVELRRARIQ